MCGVFYFPFILVVLLLVSDGHFFMVLFLFLLQWCIAPGAKKRNEKQK